MLKGDAQMKNGEKKLRTLIKATPEWQSEHTRAFLAFKLESEHSMPQLATALRRKHTPALRKPHMLRLAREWHYKCDIWQRSRSARPHLTESTQSQETEGVLPLTPQSAPAYVLPSCASAERVRREQQMQAPWLTPLPTTVTPAATHTPAAASMQATCRQESQAQAQEQSLLLNQQRPVATSMPEAIACYAAREWQPLMERALARLGVMNIPRDEHIRVILNMDESLSRSLQHTLRSATAEIEHISWQIGQQYTDFRHQKMQLALRCDISATAASDPMVQQTLTAQPEAATAAVEAFAYGLLQNEVIQQAAKQHTDLRSNMQVIQGYYDLLHLASMIRDALTQARLRTLNELLATGVWAFDLFHGVAMSLSSNFNEICNRRAKVLYKHRPSVLDETALAYENITTDANDNFGLHECP